jgi:cytoskeletal protein CcmA (bactofilin family)
MPQTTPVELAKSQGTIRATCAHVGPSVIIKGQVSGTEDLSIDGEVEGIIDLPGHVVTVGARGRVRANIQAKDVVIHGELNGNLHGIQRVELKKSAKVVGDISTERILIEDGAYFKGGIDVQKRAAPPVESEKHELARAASVAETPGVPAVQGSLLESVKK